MAGGTYLNGDTYLIFLASRGHLFEGGRGVLIQAFTILTGQFLKHHNKY